MSETILEERNRIVWRQFLRLEQTTPTEKRDWSEWHHGRREYTAWSIDLKSESLRSRFDAARAHLSEFLLEPYRRQPHITLFVCGFLADTRRFDDDYTTSQLKRHLCDMKRADLTPFEVEIGRINSFATVPFLEVLDVEGGIDSMRNLLSSTHLEIRKEAYVPHLTLGLYSGCFETESVAKKVSSFGFAQPIRHPVEQVRLVTYSAFEIAGPLTVNCAVDLGTKRQGLAQK